MKDSSNHAMLCLITDRRRLVSGVGGAETEWQALLLQQVVGAAAGGVDVVQIRENDLNAGVLAAFVRRCLDVLSGRSVRVVVNDRLDVALATGAGGVHLRETSPPVVKVRCLSPPRFVVGRSIHDAAAAAAAHGADYVMAGSVFATVSKPGAPASLGLDGFASVVQAAGECPVWAIGGVTAERIPALVGRGAKGVAAIGAFIPQKISADLTAATQELTARLRVSFDSSTGMA